VARLLARHFEEGLCILLGVLLFVAVLWQVFTRYVLNDPSLYSEEAARYLFVAVVFFGASAAVRDRSHVGIPILVEKLPPGAALVVSLAMQALVLAFCLLIVLWGYRGASQVWDLPTEAMEIPTGLVLGVVPVAMGFCALRTVLGMAEDIAAWRRGQVTAHVAGRDF
jgi:TRAP-type C4-dicarboxylate transport system permease small subunit